MRISGRFGYHKASRRFGTRSGADAARWRGFAHEECSLSRDLPRAGLALVLLLPAGCRSTQYVLRQAIGEIGVLVRSVPISQALETGGLTAEQGRKLRLIVEARDFARDELGLLVGWSFTRFHDTTGRPLAFNLSATPKDSLEPYRWWFPVIGYIDYIGFFERAVCKG